MLQRLRLKNFKAWRDTGELHLAPLTVLFGSNSAGKSSLNHLLMMLRQTAQSPNRNNVFDFGDEGALFGSEASGTWYSRMTRIDGSSLDGLGIAGDDDRPRSAK